MCGTITGGCMLTSSKYKAHAVQLYVATLLYEIPAFLGRWILWSVILTVVWLILKGIGLYRSPFILSLFNSAGDTAISVFVYVVLASLLAAVPLFYGVITLVSAL